MFPELPDVPWTHRVTGTATNATALTAEPVSPGRCGAGAKRNTSPLGLPQRERAVGTSGDVPALTPRGRQQTTSAQDGERARDSRPSPQDAGQDPTRLGRVAFVRHTAGVLTVQCALKRASFTACTERGWRCLGGRNPINLGQTQTDYIQVLVKHCRANTRFISARSRQ